MLQLLQEAERVREVKIARGQDKERAQYSFNPHPDIPKGTSLPPNAGTKKAMEQTIYLTGPGDAAGTSSAASSAKTKDGERGGPYMPRDVFTQYCSQPGSTGLMASGSTLTALPPGSIGFEQEAYADFVALKASGTLGAWELKKRTVRL